MKRLKMPKIPTRIPVPDMPSIRIRSPKKSTDAPAADDMPYTDEPAQEVKAVAQPEEVEKTEQGTEPDLAMPEAGTTKSRIRKPGVPSIPLPSISKPTLHKLSVPNIPMPSISKPSAPKLSVPKIPLPGISLPSRAKKSLPPEEQPQSEMIEETAPEASGSVLPLHDEEKLEIPAEGVPEPQLEEPPAPPEMLEATGAAPASQLEEAPVPPVMPEAVEAATTTKPQSEESPTSAESPKAKGISGIHMPAMPSFRKPKQKPATETEATPVFPSEQPSVPAEMPKAKTKVKVGMPKMPKVGMPSMSVGKSSGAKSTGKRILSVSIEGNDIRILSYHNNTVESWKSIPFDANLLRMGQVADPVGLGEEMKNATAEIDTSKCYVVCALPGLRSVSRVISVPSVGKKELETVIPREVRRTMTVSEEDNYFHWQVLPVEAGQAQVFVLAVPKEPMTLMLQALSHAGMHPSQIDLKPLALMRAVNQKDAIIANCEGNSMELVIVADDIPVLIRSVFLGEGVVNQDFAVGRISDELGRTIVTYNEINKEKPLDQDTPVYLTGAVAAGVPFALNVAALTGRTVQPLESPITIPEDLPIAEYMVNIGLLLKVV
jgi:hypothetical protein